MEAECARMGCTRGATVLLAYDPRTATAWLRDLVDAHPSLGLSLCPTHAERTSVPMGWERVDERRPAWQSYDSDSPFEPEFEPLADVEIFGSTAAAPAEPVAEPEVPLAAETRSRRRVEEERSFHSGTFDSDPFDGGSVESDRGARSERDRVEEESVASATPLTPPSPAPAPVTELRPSATPLRPAADVTPISRIDAVEDESETFDPDFVDAQFGPAHEDNADEADEAFDAIFGLDSGEESAADSVPFDLGIEDEAAPKDEPPIYHVVPVTPPPSVLAAAEASDEAKPAEAMPAEGGPAPAPQPPAAEETRPSVAKRPSKTVMDDEDISFDDIFPPKVNQPEEPPAQTPRSDQGSQQGSQGSDQQRSLFGDDFKPSHGIAERPDDGYEQRAHGKPVAHATPAVADPTETAAPTVEAPVVGPPRIEARPSYMPTRQGATSKLQVESSSPLLGRAFGFVQRD